MNKLEYFKMKVEATISPMDYMQMSKSSPNKMVMVDVRNAPPQLKKTKIAGAIEIPQIELGTRLIELPKDKIIVVYCWDVWCNLAAKAAITLIENGFDVLELSGGIAAWNIMNMPTESVIKSDSEIHASPKRVK